MCVAPLLSRLALRFLFSCRDKSNPNRGGQSLQNPNGDNKNSSESLLPPPTPPDSRSSSRNGKRTNGSSSANNSNGNGKSNGNSSSSSSSRTNIKEKTHELSFSTNSTSILHNFIASLYSVPLSDDDIEDFGDMVKEGIHESEMKIITCGKVCNKHHKICSENSSSGGGFQLQQQQDLDSILSYPDVLEASYKSKAGTVIKLHFAPATILHLLETSHMKEHKKQLPLHHIVELDAAYPKHLINEGCIKNLFVPLENDENGSGANLLNARNDVNLSNNDCNNSIYSKINRPNKSKVLTRQECGSGA